MNTPDPVPYDSFCDGAGPYIDALRRGQVLTLLKHGRPVAQVRRLPALREEVDREIVGGGETVNLGQLRSGQLDRLTAIRDGARVVVGRDKRREAVIEGVGVRLSPTAPRSRSSLSNPDTRCKAATTA